MYLSDAINKLRENEKVYNVLWKDRYIKLPTNIIDKIKYGYPDIGLINNVILYNYNDNIIEDPWTPTDTELITNYFYTKDSPLYFDISDVLKLLNYDREIYNKDWLPTTFMYLIKSNKFSTDFSYGFGEYQNEPSFNSQIVLHNGFNNTLEIGYRLSYTDLISKNYYIK